MKTEALVRGKHYNKFYEMEWNGEEIDSPGS